MPDQTILVLGASGMLGNAIYRFFSNLNRFQVIGAVRSSISSSILPQTARSRIIAGIDVENHDHLISLFSDSRPDVVINCVGVVKQLSKAEDPLLMITLNALLPHRLARLAEASGARLIHISTDCVFSGNKGNYVENDTPDATDLYGRSKLIGEVVYSNAITLRTSLIGHELKSSHSLINWFLSQENSSIKGFHKAIFSGLPTVEIARVILEYVFPNPNLHGLYHLSEEPINKFALLRLVALIYGKEINIIPDDSLVIDRSLDSTRFRKATGFFPKPWPALIQEMHDFR